MEARDRRETAEEEGNDSIRATPNNDTKSNEWSEEVHGELT
jgi:hypothetical protein